MEMIEHHNKKIIGLFLIGISFAMFVLGTIYVLTSNLNASWIGFGIVYVCTLFGILGNKKLKEKFNINHNTKIIKPLSIIILVIGIILSFAIGASLGERYLFACIFITVGVHFLPFGVKSSSILSILVILNGLLAILLTMIPLWIFIFSDGAIKLFIGLWFFVRTQKSNAGV